MMLPTYQQAENEIENRRLRWESLEKKRRLLDKITLAVLFITIILGAIFMLTEVIRIPYFGVIIAGLMGLCLAVLGIGGNYFIRKQRELFK